MRTMTIEEALRWAFCEELCKAEAETDGRLGVESAWKRVDDFAELGTWVDRSPNAFGVIPDFVGGGEPHADAVKIHATVRELSKRDGYDIGAGWNPFPEWNDAHGLIADEVAAAVDLFMSRGDRLNGRHVVNRVVTAILVGRPPDWSAEQPGVEELNGWFVLRHARDSFNRAVRYEADGYDRRKKRPMPGAYRKYRLTEPLIGAISARLDWQLWQDGLAVLAKMLAGNLDSIRLKPFHPDRQPWARGSYFSDNGSQAIGIAR